MATSSKKETAFSLKILEEPKEKSKNMCLNVRKRTLHFYFHLELNYNSNTYRSN
jgi:hypothetical protein